MSHFTVGVLTIEGGKSLDELLAPFDENSNEDVPEKYLKFVDITKDYLVNYENRNINIIISPDGKYYESDDEFVVDKNADDGYIPALVPAKDVYSDFDSYMIKHERCSKDEKTNSYGYWYNTKAKWDYYIEGGRWDGVLLTKKGKYTNCAMLKDIDWETMEKKQRENAEKVWNSNPQGVNKFLYNIYANDTKEDYIKRNSEFNTFAIVTPDGEWYEKGEMGWFGISSESDDESNRWSVGFFDRFIKEADENLKLTIVDCHI